MGDHPNGASPRSRRAGSSVLTPPTGVPAVPPPAAPAVPAAPPRLDPPAPRTVVDPCTCGHSRDAHEHYRPGSDCGACGAGACGRFVPEGARARRLFRRRAR